MNRRRPVVACLLLALCLVFAGAAFGQGPSPAASNVRLVGQIGGLCQAAAAQGQHAYFGIGPGLLILDVSNPAVPARLGQAILPDAVLGIHPASSHLFLAVKTAGLWALDLSNPAQPAVTGSCSLPGEANGVFVVGDRAYVAAGAAGLHVVDVADPAHPALLGTCDTPGEALGVYVAGDLAYVADKNGLRVIDVADPLQPIEIGSFAGSGGRAVFVSGQYAYLAAESNGLRILDVSDPAHPNPVGGYYFSGPAMARGIWVTGNYAYLACWRVGLKVLNVTNPTQPVAVGTNDSLDDPRGIWVLGERAFVATGQSSPQILDIADPARPRTFSTYNVPGEVMRVAVAGRHAYLVANCGTLPTVDVSQPGAPVQASVYRPVYDPNSYNPCLFDVAVQGRYAYLAGAGEGFRVLDISDPAHPTPVSVLGNFWNLVDSVAVSGNYAFLGSTQARYLYVVDISDPAHPLHRGGCHTGSWSSIDVMGRYAYLSAGGQVDGHYLYAISGSMEVIDIGNPDSPAVVATLSGTPGEAGLYVIDIADPLHPTLVGSAAVAGARRIAAEGRYAYVAAWDAGVKVFDVSDPSHPVEAGSYDTAGGINDPWNPQGGAADLAVAGDLIYVADRAGGLAILRHAQEAVGTITTEGGTLVSASDGTTYTFPAGTFTDTVTITHTPRRSGLPAAPEGLVGIGHGYEIGAVYAASGQSAQPAPGRTYSVTVQYSNAERGMAIEGTLALYAWDGSGWVKEPTSTVDATANRVTATPDHFSLWAIFGQTRRLFLPAVLKRG